MTRRFSKRTKSRNATKSERFPLAFADKKMLHGRLHVNDRGSDSIPAT
jgi:hypothetical protein